MIEPEVLKELRIIVAKVPHVDQASGRAPAHVLQAKEQGPRGAGVGRQGEVRSIPGTGEMRVLGSQNEHQAVSIEDAQSPWRSSNERRPWPNPKPGGPPATA